MLLLLLLRSLSVCLHMNVCSLSLVSAQIYSMHDGNTHNSGHLMGKSCYWMVFGWLSSHLAIHFVLFLIFGRCLSLTHSFLCQHTHTHAHTFWRSTHFPYDNLTYCFLLCKFILFCDHIKPHAFIYIVWDVLNITEPFAFNKNISRQRRRRRQQIFLLFLLLFSETECFFSSAAIFIHTQRNPKKC